MTDLPHIPSAWDKIFQPSPEAPLTESEQEQAIQELARAFHATEQMRASTAYQRVKGLIAGQMARSEDENEAAQQAS
jgi:hypothetical protein